MQNPTWYNNQVHGFCNIAVQFIMMVSRCRYIVTVSTTLSKSVCSWSHEESVPTCMNKPVNNTVQAGILNHVQACKLNHACSNWPDQPCSSLSTGKNKLCVFTCYVMRKCVLQIQRRHCCYRYKYIFQFTSNSQECYFLKREARLWNYSWLIRPQPPG